LNVTSSCCDFRSAADSHFTGAKVTKKLRAYRNGQLEATTRALRDTVIDLGLNGGSLLDIGGGFGALTFELMDRGMGHATIVDASAAYTEMARDEAVRRGQSQSTDVITGDVVELGSTLRSASLVTLDRVVCCYPTYEPMLEEALDTPNWRSRFLIRAIAGSCAQGIGSRTSSVRASRRSGRLCIPHLRYRRSWNALGSNSRDGAKRWPGPSTCTCDATHSGYRSLLTGPPKATRIPEEL
jgi:SAM-dependent methyltransferase